MSNKDCYNRLLQQLVMSLVRLVLNNHNYKSLHMALQSSNEIPSHITATAVDINCNKVLIKYFHTDLIVTKFSYGNI